MYFEKYTIFVTQLLELNRKNNMFPIHPQGLSIIVITFLSLTIAVFSPSGYATRKDSLRACNKKGMWAHTHTKTDIIYKHKI